MNNFNNLYYLKSVLKITKKCLNNDFEVAFIGYSNSGKSSAINALANNKNKLSRVSKTPGSTRMFNIFQIRLGYRIVDLPGYGYSIASKKLKIHWKEIIFKYLKIRDCLRGIIIFMDIRYPMKSIDEKVLRLAISKNMKILILLNKSDKLNNNERKLQLIRTRKKLNVFSKDIAIILFSSLNKLGVDLMQKTLTKWYNQYKIDNIFKF